jgi:hypothetical protein
MLMGTVGPRYIAAPQDFRVYLTRSPRMPFVSSRSWTWRIQAILDAIAAIQTLTSAIGIARLAAL